MRIGLIDVDSKIPNFALMKISAYHKAKLDNVEWATCFNEYDKVYASKIFTFSEDYNYLTLQSSDIMKGGTGYDISKKLPYDIDDSLLMDYSLYPKYKGSLQFFSRGYIRNCSFCLVREKEGNISPAHPVDLNPMGEYIEVLDNNFFANPEWRYAINYLIKKKQFVKLHGVDLRIMDEEQAYYLNQLKIKHDIHIAWDDPHMDLKERLIEMLKYIRPHKITCYVLIGYNSTIEQDLYRLDVLRGLRIRPFVMPYRDYKNSRKRTQYEIDIAQWANKAWIFYSCEFKDFQPRKGFKCNAYLMK